MSDREPMPEEVAQAYAVIARYRAAQRRKRQATCAVCGRPFEAQGGRKCCSPACTWKAYYIRNRDRYLQRQRERRAARRRAQGAP